MVQYVKNTNALKCMHGYIHVHVHCITLVALCKAFAAREADFMGCPRNTPATPLAVSSPQSKIHEI